MEKMSTCLDKLLRQMQEPIPENILGKMAVAVSFLSFIHFSFFLMRLPFDFQIIKALNYLKEKHGIIHRGELFFSLRLLEEVVNFKLITLFWGEILFVVKNVLLG